MIGGGLVGIFLFCIIVLIRFLMKLRVMLLTQKYSLHVNIVYKNFKTIIIAASENPLV